MPNPLRVAVVGDLDPSFIPHVATNDALEHAAAALGVELHSRWFATGPLENELGEVLEADALWCAPGSPYRSLTGAVRALRYAREEGVPTLGTCGGCQHIIIEYARNVLGFQDAQHAEYDPYASRLFISELACSLAGQKLPVRLEPGSLVAELYGATRAVEEYYCNFGLNPEYQSALDQGGLRVTGFDDDGEARVLEQVRHPFYLATVFVPQTRSRREQPHPLALGLLRAAMDRAAASPASA